MSSGRLKKQGTSKPPNNSGTVCTAVVHTIICDMIFRIEKRLIMIFAQYIFGSLPESWGHNKLDSRLSLLLVSCSRPTISACL